MTVKLSLTLWRWDFCSYRHHACQTVGRIGTERKSTTFHYTANLYHIFQCIQFRMYFFELFNLFEWYREREGCQVDVFPVLLDYLRPCCKDYDDHFSQIRCWHLTISTVSYSMWKINISLLVTEKDEEQTRKKKQWKERDVDGSTVIEICHSWRRRMSSHLLSPCDNHHHPLSSCPSLPKL